MNEEKKQPRGFTTYTYIGNSFNGNFLSNLVPLDNGTGTAGGVFTLSQSGNDNGFAIFDNDNKGLSVIIPTAKLDTNTDTQVAEITSSVSIGKFNVTGIPGYCFANRYSSSDFGFFVIMEKQAQTAFSCIFDSGSINAFFAQTAAVNVWKEVTGDLYDENGNKHTCVAKIKINPSFNSIDFSLTETGVVPIVNGEGRMGFWIRMAPVPKQYKGLRTVKGDTVIQIEVPAT